MPFFLITFWFAVSSSSLDMEGGKLIYSATRVVDEGFRKHFREEIPGLRR